LVDLTNEEQRYLHDVIRKGKTTARRVAGQRLARRIPSIDVLREAIAAWEAPRNAHQTKIHWQFSTDIARTKLTRLYPTLESTDAPAKPAEDS
jgi:hypothetical protein